MTERAILIELPHSVFVRGIMQPNGATHWTVFEGGVNSTPLGRCVEVTDKAGNTHREGDDVAIAACQAMLEIRKLWLVASEATRQGIPIRTFFGWFARFAGSADGRRVFEHGIRLAPPKQRLALMAQAKELAQLLDRRKATGQ